MAIAYDRCNRWDIFAKKSMEIDGANKNVDFFVK